MTSIHARLVVFVSCAFAGGCSSSDSGTTATSDGGSGSDVHACQVKSECFQTDGSSASVQALCNNFKGTAIASCSGTRVGCCHIGGENQCWFNSDGGALKSVCESQHGTWTPN